MDEFHTRGRAATIDLARFLNLNGSERVLDVGCGIGGPSRYLAKTFGCRVVGLDLTPEFCRVATMLAERTGLLDKVEYRLGNALAMPFEDLSFDVVWSQNVVMNITDRHQLYREIHRVLKPRGRYAFSDVVAGLGGPPYFPMPWAHDPSSSFLLTVEATRTELGKVGFRRVGSLIFEGNACSIAGAGKSRRFTVGPRHTSFAWGRRLHHVQKRVPKFFRGPDRPGPRTRSANGLADD